MKWLLSLILVILFVGLGFAGEKEELQLKMMVLQERLARLQAEYNVTEYQIKELKPLLDAVLKEEKSKQPKVEGK